MWASRCHYTLFRHVHDFASHSLWLTLKTFKRKESQIKEKSNGGIRFMAFQIRMPLPLEKVFQRKAYLEAGKITDTVQTVSTHQVFCSLPKYQDSFIPSSNRVGGPETEIIRHQVIPNLYILQRFFKGNIKAIATFANLRPAVQFTWALNLSWLLIFGLYRMNASPYARNVPSPLTRIG